MDTFLADTDAVADTDVVADTDADWPGQIAFSSGLSQE